MLDLGCQLILIDGAIDRKSIASPDTSDAIILSTGAVLSRKMKQSCGRDSPRRESLQDAGAWKTAAVREAIENNNFDDKIMLVNEQRRSQKA